MKLALCGPSGSGKDLVANWFAANTSLRYSGYSTSFIIAPHMAAEYGCTVEEAMQRRHADRERWLAKGNELRKDDVAYLARETLKHGDIVVGIRTPQELLAARNEGLFDLSLWIHRVVKRDPTMKYDWDLCDLIVPNDWDLADLYYRLKRLARSWGLLA